MKTRSSTRLAELTENEVDGSNSNYVQSVQLTRRTMSRISQDRYLQNRIVLSRNDRLNYQVPSYLILYLKSKNFPSTSTSLYLKLFFGKYKNILYLLNIFGRFLHHD